jgi:hypothetical protein
MDFDDWSISPKEIDLACEQIKNKLTGPESEKLRSIFQDELEDMIEKGLTHSWMTDEQRDRAMIKRIELALILKP